MTDHREDPLDEVIAGFRQMPVPDRPDDDDLLARLASLGAGGARTPGPPPHPFRRFLMRPAVRYVSAAALLVGAFGWLALSPSPSLALAEVIKAAEQHKLVRFRMKQTTDDRQVRLTGSGTSTVYVDLVAPRLRIETRTKTLNDVLDFRHIAVYDYRNDRFLAANSSVQVATKDRAKDEMQAIVIEMVEGKGLAKKSAVLSRIGRTKTDDIKPMSDLGANRAFLDSLRGLQANKGTLFTTTDLDGREVAKYRLRDGNETSSLWVDPRTKLPIRIEFEIIDPSPRIARNEWIYTDFEWDPAVSDPAKLFSTEPPAGYTIEDHTDEP